MALGLEINPDLERFSGASNACRLAGLSLSLQGGWQVASGRDREKTTSVSRKGKDGEESSAGDLSLKLAPEPRRAPAPDQEQNEAKAALLLPAVHLIMVVCCEED